MSFLDKVVQQTITTATRTPTVAGFGTALIAAYHTVFPELVKQYTNADDMLTDGFLATDQAYKDALTLKNQNPAPQNFKVGRLTTAVTQTVDFIPTNTTVGYVYSGTVTRLAVENAFEYEVQSGDAVADIVAGLVADIDAFTGVSCADNATHATLTVDAAGEQVEIDAGISIDLLDTTLATNLSTELAACAAEDDDWYCLLLTQQSEPAINAAAAWIEARRKICVVQTSDWGAKDAGETTDVASDLSTNSYARTGLIWHHQIGSGAAAAWAGVMLPKTPGKATWAFKLLKGVPVTTTLTDAEADALEAKNANYYGLLAGNGATFEGTTGAGEYFDVTRLVDWVYARNQEAVAGKFLNEDKVPFTDNGIATIKGLVFSVLLQAYKNGGLTKPDLDTSVTVPAASDVSDTNKNNRTLPDVNYQGFLAGAIHKVQLTGVVSV